MSKKRMSVANFNVVFLEKGEEKPLLDYFDSIVMPALLSGRKRVAGGATYSLKDIDIIKDETGEYIFRGLFIKKTVLEVKSDLDQEGNLVYLDHRYPTAPFSMFAVYLKNHRMVFVENQKGSPNIRSFGAMIKYLIGCFIREKDRIREEQGLEPLPAPIVNIVGIPVKEKIEEVLYEAKKIKQLTLRFYPLNGDLDYRDMFDNMAQHVRQKVGSKKGEVILKSPKNIKGVVDLVKESNGTVDPILKVEFSDKSEKTITSSMMSERSQVEIDDNDAQNGLAQMVSHGNNLGNINYVSETNQALYNKNIEKIKLFVKE